MCGIRNIMQKRGVKPKASVIPEPVPLDKALPDRAKKAREALARKVAEAHARGEKLPRKIKPRIKEEIPEDSNGLFMGDINYDEEVAKIMGDSKFLDDLIWVYRKWGGKEKMLKDIKDDQRMRKHFLKSIMSLEVKKMDLLVKRAAPNTGGKAGVNGIGGGGNKGNFFFILKGLDKEDDVIEGVKGGKIDPKELRQILDADPGEVPEEEMKVLDFDYRNDDYTLEGDIEVADDGTVISEDNMG